MIFDLNNPEATEQALLILRDPTIFTWDVIFMLVVVLFIYFSELGKKNWKGIVGGLTLYGIHWFVEIINAWIQNFSEHALWTVTGGTAYLIFVGVGIELSLMFSIAGLATTKLLPEDKKEKILGINARLFMGVFNAALASIIEIFLVTTGYFVWVHPWWNSLTVFLFVYIPFFCGATFSYFWKPKKQKIVLGAIWGTNVLLLLISFLTPLVTI
ncbi:MAG: hypothetical protein ACTSVZ_05360 [Promethearchaeota archaeon]